MDVIRAVGVALMLYFASSVANAEEKPLPVTDIQRAIVSQKLWLNTAKAPTAEDLRGRIILLDFWTLGCINCIHVIPDLHYLEKKFGSKLTVIGIHSAKFDTERDTENIRSAILRYGIDHPVVNDFDFSIWRKFKVKAWPTFVLVGPGGAVVSSYSGEGNRAAMEKDIQALIAKTPKLNTTPLAMKPEKMATLDKLLRFPAKLVYVADFKDAPALIVADAGHNRIVVLKTDGTIQEIIGGKEAGWKDGDFASARFNAPHGIAYKAGMLYVADTNNHLLRRVDFSSHRVTTLAGTGEQGYEKAAKDKPALKTPISSPWDLAFFPNDAHLIIAMAGTHQLWGYDTQTQKLSVLAGNGDESVSDGVYPANSLSQPSGLSPWKDQLWFVDAESSALRVFEKGAVTTLIGAGLFDFGLKDGLRAEARMQHPLGVYADDSGVYVTDTYNHVIRRFDPQSGKIETLAGSGVHGRANGPFAQATFNEPSAITRAGDILYIADTNNHAIRLADLKSGTVSTLEVREKPAEPPAAAPPLPAPAKPSASDLPNLEIGEKGMAADIPIPVTLDLAPGWKINDESASYLALFEMGVVNAVSVKQFNRDALKKKKIELPPLKRRAEYRLQGTLYYCEEKAGAKCLVKSLDMDLKTQQHGEEALSIQLR